MTEAELEAMFSTPPLTYTPLAPEDLEEIAEYHEGGLLID